jgi:hypothetical protein
MPIGITHFDRTEGSPRLDFSPRTLLLIEYEFSSLMRRKILEPERGSLFERRKVDGGWKLDSSNTFSSAE